MHAWRLTVVAALLLSLGACASDDDFVPLDTSSRSATGTASAEPSGTATPEPEPTSTDPEKADKRLIRDLVAYGDESNASLGKTVIDRIEPSATGFDVMLNPSMGELGLQQARTLVEQWNREIVSMLADAGRSADDGSVQYFLGGQLVARNEVDTDPWAVTFDSILDQ